MKIIESIKPIFFIFFITFLFTITSYSNTNGNKKSGVSARKYYISQNGNDFNMEPPSIHPWKSLKKLEEINFQPGDSICFECGSSWNWKL